MAGKKGRSGGAGKLSPDEHARRSTWRADRHGSDRPCEGAQPSDFYPWLVGLSAIAQREGRHFLEYVGLPGNREAFRRYLEHRADGERRYPLRNAPLEEKIRDFALGCTLLEAVRWRRR